MSIRRFFIGLAIASIFVIGIGLLGSVPQATAETLNFRNLVHVTKIEAVSIPDTEGHLVRLQVREGVQVFDNGELAWIKAVLSGDIIKGAGPFSMYSTYTFQDGSTITTHTKGRVEATPAAVQTAAKWSGEIIQGTGRFQGIKGKVTSTSKMLPPEKGEQAGKSLSEGSIVYTLPSK